MKIIIPGGSGQIGQILKRTFEKEGHTVIVLSRGGKKQAPIKNGMAKPWGHGHKNLMVRM